MRRQLVFTCLSGVRSSKHSHYIFRRRQNRNISRFGALYKLNNSSPPRLITCSSEPLRAGTAACLRLRKIELRAYPAFRCAPPGVPPRFLRTILYFSQLAVCNWRMCGKRYCTTTHILLHMCRFEESGHVGAVGLRARKGERVAEGLYGVVCPEAPSPRSRLHDRHSRSKSGRRLSTGPLLPIYVASM